MMKFSETKWFLGLGWAGLGWVVHWSLLRRISKLGAFCDVGIELHITIENLE